MAVVVNPQFAVPGQDAVQRGSYGQMGNVIQGQQPYVANPHPVVFPTHGTRPDFVTAHTPVYSSVYSGATPEQAHFGEIRSSNPNWGVVFTPMPYNDWSPVINATAQRIAQGNNTPVVRMEDVLNTMPRLPRRGGGASPAVQNGSGGSGGSAGSPDVKKETPSPAYVPYNLPTDGLDMGRSLYVHVNGNPEFGRALGSLATPSGNTITSMGGELLLNDDTAQALRALQRHDVNGFNYIVNEISKPYKSDAVNTWVHNDSKYQPQIVQWLVGNGFITPEAGKVLFDRSMPEQLAGNLPPATIQSTQAQAQAQSQYPGGNLNVLRRGDRGTLRPISFPLTQQGVDWLNQWKNFGLSYDPRSYDLIMQQLSETPEGQQFLQAAKLTPVDTSTNWTTFGARNLPTILGVGSGGPVWFNAPSGLGTVNDFVNFGNALMRLSPDQQRAYVAQAIKANPQYAQQIQDYLSRNYNSVALP